MTHLLNKTLPKRLLLSAMCFLRSHFVSKMIWVGLIYFAPQKFGLKRISYDQNSYVICNIKICNLGYVRKTNVSKPVSIFHDHMYFGSQTEVLL